MTEELKDNFKKEAFALFDALTAAGMNVAGMGAYVLGMSLGCLLDAGVTREQIHQMIDQMLDKATSS